VTGTSIWHHSASPTPGISNFIAKAGAASGFASVMGSASNTSGSFVLPLVRQLGDAHFCFGWFPSCSPHPH